MVLSTYPEVVARAGGHDRPDGRVDQPPGGPRLHGRRLRLLALPAGDVDGVAPRGRRGRAGREPVRRRGRAVRWPDACRGPSSPATSPRPRPTPTARRASSRTMAEGRDPTFSASCLGDARSTASTVRASWTPRPRSPHRSAAEPGGVPQGQPIGVAGGLVLRVMSWNLWWRFGPWAERQPAIAAVLAAERPDLVGLQEVWVEEGGANQAEVLAGRRGLHAAVGEVRFRDGLAFTNAVLSRWPLRTVGAPPLPRADGSPSHRQVVLATVDAPFGAGHVPDHPPRLALRRLRRPGGAGSGDRRPRWPNAGGDPAAAFPAVLTGDLNAVPDADELRLLTGATGAAGARTRLHRRLGRGRRRRPRPHLGPPQPPSRRRHLAPAPARLRTGLLAPPQAARLGAAVLAGGRPSRSGA